MFCIRDPTDRISLAGLRYIHLPPYILSSGQCVLTHVSGVTASSLPCPAEDIKPSLYVPYLLSLSQGQSRKNLSPLLFRHTCRRGERGYSLLLVLPGVQMRSDALLNCRLQMVT
ncbi:hypothetical protein CDAR_561551 [Caerostris darwini]|uniref:Uncharacterized protein n=1 Tax=Caerostris darwini TaxID=1538125 RepID=A0AAV4MJJ3_9ARAC|nr:hypothetical protein CDAR_561551 [Caerostris darwini]